ncbi:VCBS repeat-containing protein [Micromonospora sp. ALFpr18c]|uniref:DNRLRE domain-containing protein n=1 Tax=unclassified Micromonospora TaxID=2617518 RepID=UPI00124AF13B|nr:DNRLRE domain-containing protein [Micromonospora sp. ALFpr18c]KAB1938169.1 VCBS repeat-containing protein [Micromonospora sp. ALFpr18c]
MTVPRLLSPFVRTRTRLTLTLGVLLAALVATLLPLSRSDQPRRAALAPVPAAPRNEASAMADALKIGKDVLVDTATTATSLTWAMPSGQLRTTIHAVPQRAKNTAGQWAAVDNTLTRAGSATGGLDIRPVNAATPVRFSGGSAPGQSEGTASILTEMDVEGHTIAYTWPGRLPKPVLDGPRALYPEVHPGVDLLMVARDDGGFGQLLIVKNREAATIQAVRSLTYGLRSDTVVFRRDATTGGVLALDKVSGEEVSSIPSPFAWDSAGRDPEAPEAGPRTAVATPSDVLALSGLVGSEPGARQAQIPTRLDGDGTGNVRLHLDAAATGLLTGADVLFPIFLDPTLISGKLAWATVYSQYPNGNTYNGTNYNSGTTDARVGYEEDSPLRTRSFWRMGYDAGMKGATVTSASFKVLNNHSWSCSAREMQLWLTGSISSGSTWNKQPAWKEEQSRRSFAYGYGSNCTDDYVSFDVKKGAQDAANGGWSNLTFGMRASSESDTFTWRKFKVTSAELSVTYNRPPNEPTGGTTSPGGACVPGTGGGVMVAKTNIVLSASSSDADGNLKSLRFRFWKNGTAVPAGTVVTTTSAGKATLTIPAGNLEDKAVYSWEVSAEDAAGASSSFFPPGSEPCRLTIDASAPPAPDVTSDVFKEATPDGATWATVTFGETGPITFAASGATSFTYSFESIGTVSVPATAGTATVPNLAPRHAGPTTLHVYAYDAVGNRSARTDYTFYLPPRSTADGPGDTGGDGIPDLLLVDSSGNLRNYAGDTGGELYAWLVGSYAGDKLNPTGHWFDPGTGKAALVTKHSDTYPGDGTTDMFARTPDGGFWLYPGDGYGTFDVDRRLRVLLPATGVGGTPIPAPDTWTQIKAVGDITGDKLPDLILRAGTAFWTLSGYTGASFQEATLMEGTAWARREVVNVADIDLDGTPDMLWRNLDNGNMYVRHGKPGSTSGSVNLDSLKSAAASRSGDVSYGTGWSEANISAMISIPDVNGDRVPDFWTRSGTDGMMRIYHPSTTNTGGPVKVVLGDDWRGVKSFG